MRREGIAILFLMAVAGGILLFYSPDTLSLVFTVIMILLMAVGYIFGMIPAMRYTSSFICAKKRIERARTVESATVWLALQQEESLFDKTDLDSCFLEYRFAVNNYEKQDEEPLCDLEDFIGEDMVRNAGSYHLIHQIPGTLTGMGILGTFLGLIIGLQKISFTSVTSTMEGLEFLLGGIRTAFYTSIAGEIFSIIFNLSYNMLWDRLTIQLDDFHYRFYLYVLPRTEEIVRRKNAKYQAEVLRSLHSAEDSLKAEQTFLKEGRH